jgi:hypothetical protein
VNHQTLRPGPNPRLGLTKFGWWLAHVPPPKAITQHAPKD